MTDGLSGVMFYEGTNVIQFYTYKGSGISQYVDSGVVPSQRLYNLTGTAKVGQVAELFIDRERYVSSGIITLLVPYTSASYYSILTGGGDGSGMLHRFFMWGRALNPSEIAQLHYSPYQFFWVPGRRTFFLPIQSSSPQPEAPILTTYLSLKPSSFGIVGLPKRGFGPLVKPPPNAIIDKQHPLARGLGWWLNCDGIGTIYDKVSNATATPQNCTVSQGEELVLDGSTSYVALASARTLPANSACTVFVWYYQTKTDTLISLIGNTTDINAPAIRLVDGTSTVKYLGWRLGGTSVTITGNSFPVNTNTLCCATREVSGAMRAYRNGVDVTSGTPSNTSAFVFDALGLTNLSGTLARYFGGLIRAAATYSRALNPNEIAQLHYSPYQFFWVPGRRTFFLPITAQYATPRRWIKRYSMFFGP